MPKPLPDRRLFLKTLGLTALAPLAGTVGSTGGSAAFAAPVPGPAAVAAAAGLRATPLPGGMFLVDGWVLTAADLEALGIHAS